jgi:hypothetical protein
MIKSFNRSQTTSDVHNLIDRRDDLQQGSSPLSNSMISGLQFQETETTEDPHQQDRDISAEKATQTDKNTKLPPCFSRNCLPVPEWACTAMSRPWEISDAEAVKAYAAACEALVSVRIVSSVILKQTKNCQMGNKTLTS